MTISFCRNCILKRYLFISHRYHSSSMLQRYNSLNSASDIVELNQCWKHLHAQNKYPLFTEYCKMIQMLASFKNFSEISSVYDELLNHISYPPQHVKQWKDFDISMNPMHVTQMMRCAKIANDWHTMYHFMQMYLENNWKFNKISARFALECCWRHCNESSSSENEQIVVKIWNNLIAHDVPNEYCFIQLLLNLNKTFCNVQLIKSVIHRVLNDMNKYLLFCANNKNRSLFLVIFDEMLCIADKHHLNDVTLLIAQQILEPNSNLFLSFADLHCHSSSDIAQYSRYGKIPLRLMVKLLNIYDQSTNIEKSMHLFETMKRFRSICLQNINLSKNENNDFLLHYWNETIFDEKTLPIFMKIAYDYFYALALDESANENIKERVLKAYRNKAENVCKYVNYSIDSPLASLYLCGVDYLCNDIKRANICTMNVIEKYFEEENGQNNECLLRQWENGQFVLNLSPSVCVPDIMFIPLIVSSLIYYAKIIPKQDKNLKSIKVRIDIEKMNEFERIFSYLSLHFAPKIEYEVIGKVSNWMIVVELELNSLLKWCEYHNVVCFQDVDKQSMLTQTCDDLLPQILCLNQSQRDNIKSRKQLLKDLNTTLSSSAL